MTTPASNTPIAIIADAMFEAKLIQEGQTPSSEQLARNMRRLTDMINAWVTMGMKLWLESDQSVTLVAGQKVYTLGPSGSVDMTRPLRVDQAYYLDNSTPANQRPLGILSWQEYLTLGQVDQTGAISSIFVNKQQTLMYVSCWPVPDTETATGTVHVLIRTQVTNPINLTETMNFPIEWRIALLWGLADEIATGQPQAVVQKCAGKADQYRRMLEDWDVEDTPTRFTPDMQQTAYTSNSFR